MRYILRSIFSLILVLSSSLASATEITPFGGYRMGGEFTGPSQGDTYDVSSAAAFGIILGLPFGKPENKTMFELTYSHQSTELKTKPEFQTTHLFDLDIDYFTVGGTYLIGDGTPLQPFISAGIGASYFKPGTSGLDSETRLALSIGGGAKWMISKQVGLRFELRGIATSFGLGDEEDTIFCGNNECLTIEKNVFFQTDAMLGLIVKF
ncbi:MAG: outer membrane beta-barrel protein [Pseudomonadota bacterium]|nr:outer membrane beta-barrel protein [Pseudomonadota bacterium]